MRSDPSPSTASPLTRRRLFGTGAAGALSLGLAACGSSASSSTTADAAGPAKRTIQTAKGAVTVPARPSRVICTDPGFSWETLVEVGLTPVGVPPIADSLAQPASLAKVKGIPTVLSTEGEPDLEKIAALRPDLILANSDGIGPYFAKLSAVAPVAAYAFNFPSDWVTLDHDYANAVNRTEQLAAVTDRYDRAVQALKSRYGTVIAKQKWALVTESENQVYAWGSRSSAGPVLSAAGAQFSAGAPGSGTPFSPLSLERLDSLSDATVILYGAGSDGTTPYLDTSSLLKQPVFKALPAAKAGHVYPLASWFAYGYQDALSQLDSLERVCESLAA